MESAPLGPLANAADGCLVFDLHGSVVAANDAVLETLDCTREGLLGRAAWEVLTCVSPESFELMVEGMRTEGTHSLLAHLRCSDGRLVASDTRLWLASQGGSVHVFALAREMRGYQRIADERDRLAQLVEASAEIVVLFDRELRVSYANPAALEKLGFARIRDFRGLTLHELVPPENRNHLEERVVPALERGAWEGELELRSWRSPLERTPCWVSAFPVVEEGTPRPVGFALTAHDVGPRRAADQRRTRLLRLAEVSRRVAILLLENDDLNAAVGEILTRVAQVLGASRAHLDRIREGGGKVFRTHVWSPVSGATHHADAPPEHRAGGWATEILARGEALRVDDAVPLHNLEEGHGLLQSGVRAILSLPVFISGRLESVFTFSCHQPHVWQDDEVAATQIIVDSFARGVERQIAERDQRQARLELEEAVEREKVANRYKSQFLASMSHELRTPMNAIRGYAELLSRPGSERALQQTWIRNLRRSTEYLLGLVHDVLDLSKIEAGHMRLEREPAALADVLAGVEDLVAPGAREKCLDFELLIEGEVPATFDTDPVRLKQILVNLAGNAIKFTSKGSVAIRVRERLGFGDARTLEVAVEDTGIGIPAEAMPRLFQPFSQVHKRRGGTGLGLQISRSLARLLGGDITVVSEPDRGSTFTLELPLRNASGVLRELPRREDAAPAPRELPAVLRGRRFLVVDDSLENREVLRFLLQEAGATSESAADGREGVERAQAAERSGKGFDAVLMDMNMPVMDGFEATRALVAAGFEAPVIALTALALSGDEQRCRDAGCVDYIGKPIVPSLFYDVLAQHVRPRAVPELADARKAREVPVGAAPAPGGNLFSLSEHPRFKGLVQRYVASFPELVERIRGLARDGDLEQVRTLVHRLRGTAATYGFPALSEAAGRCEDAIRAGAQQEEIARELDDLLGRLTLAAAG